MASDGWEALTLKRYWTETNIEMTWWERFFVRIAGLRSRKPWRDWNTRDARWWCDNCWRAVDLNQHLRCELCDSDAVIEFERVPYGTKAVVGDAKNRNRR
jgi:hypothetical protein